MSLSLVKIVALAPPFVLAAIDVGDPKFPAQCTLTSGHLRSTLTKTQLQATLTRGGLRCTFEKGR